MTFPSAPPFDPRPTTPAGWPCPPLPAPPDDPIDVVGCRVVDRVVAPARDGQVPAAGEAAEMDWSSDGDSAAVGRLVGALAGADAVMVEVVEALMATLERHATETTLGVAPELVLAQTGRVAGFDIRTLLRCAHTLARLPATRLAFGHGRLSWSQVRAIVTAVKPLRIDSWHLVDDLVDELAPGLADVEADALVFEVDWLAARLAAQEQADRDRRPIEDNRLYLKPRLDGSGTLSGAFDPTHFPILAEVIDRQTTGLEHVPDPATEDDDDTLTDAALTAGHAHAAAIAGRNASRRAAALFRLVTGWDHHTLQTLPQARQGAGAPAVLLTCHVDTLLDGTVPALLLSRLTGRMRVTSDVARRWIDAHGADIRLTAVDDVGQVVGVGHRKRFAPGWLRDAILARDLHDTAPTSTTPARLCDVEHTISWNQTQPDQGGRTDVDNLALISRRFHTVKTAKTWQVDQRPDRTTTWTATATGYRITTRPPPHLPIPMSDPELSRADKNRAPP